MSRKWNASLSPVRIFRQRKKPARIQWTRIGRQTSRNWAFATHRTLQTFLPQEAGGTVNLNIGNGGDGTVQINLRGCFQKRL